MVCFLKQFHIKIINIPMFKKMYMIFGQVEASNIMMQLLYKFLK